MAVRLRGGRTAAASQRRRKFTTSNPDLDQSGVSE